MPAFGSLFPFVGGGKGGGRGRKRPTPGGATAAAAGAAAAGAKKKPKPKQQQTYLDFGQKSHGKRTLCGACGMLYVNGEAEDERDHAAFCRSVDAGLAFPGWKAERVAWGREGKERVVEVRPGDGPAQLHKMAEVKRIVDQDMGFVPLAEGQKALGPQEKAFLYVKDKRVVGCLVAAKVGAAFPVLTSTEDDDDSEEEEGKEEEGEGEEEGKENGPRGAAAVEPQPVPTAAPAAAAATAAAAAQAGEAKGKAPAAAAALLPKGVAYSLTAQTRASLGVKQVWVGQACRRQGVARRLVEVARAKFYYGFVVPRDQLAFSQLSTHGYAFAQSYMAGQRLLVY